MIYTEKINFDFSKFSNENLDVIIALCKKEKESRKWELYKKDLKNLLSALKTIAQNAPETSAFFCECCGDEYTWQEMFDKIYACHSHAFEEK